MTVILVSQAVFVAAILVWLFITRAPNALWAAMLCGAGAIALLGASLVGIWVYPPLWLMALLSVGCFVILAARIWRRAGGDKARGVGRATLRFVGAPVWTILGALLIWQGVSGRLAPPGETLAFAAPLRGAGFCSISGGASPWLNFHMETLASGKEAYRGQSYGVDFIALSPLGLRTLDAHLFEAAPRDPSAYRIFGADIHAPCAGEVLIARDGMIDQPAGEPDLSAMAGNHVVLRCDRHDVLLAHLRQGSVVVSEGQRVAAGALLGQVGNTGASDEPHLHLSVQRAVDPQPSFAGAPVHVTFDGRFMARGVCLPH